MAADPDDDALRWEGDDDPTLAPGWKVVGSPAAPATGGSDVSGMTDVPDGADASGETSTGGAALAAPAAGASAQTGSVELVVLGVLGGAYLLYTVGWLIAALGAAPVFADPVATFMYGLGRWFTVLAAPLWFGVVLWLTRERPRLRLIWLVAGAVLLVPVPFLLRG
ncbi:DNA polymerase III subunit gamma/tau [Agromyces protaetiae]|uniref:DNA polymerase III subunit gamma/tau n=1 Tax=Agromyces protaetiae TaxID=2509455 RepID=A0A4P6FF69_9MICO|nr:DNA polymerase III subunit gamma/tau [Agromyces protaetiae]QAY73703.1 DNA polymerase III subunit gamma/tau [Agromyces protaetiae]